MNKPAAKRKPVPKFRSEAKEREFWDSKTVDATEYFDPAAVVTAQLKNLKPSTTSISLRLSDSLLDGIRQQANKLEYHRFQIIVSYRLILYIPKLFFILLKGA